MSRAGKTFHLAARLLPREVRHDVIDLYAFCRTVDDLADDSSFSVAERRQDLKALAAALEQHRVLELRMAGWSFSASGMLPAAAATLVRTALGDLKQKQPATEPDVLQYAFGVAGTVGLMMANLLGAEPAGYSAAVALGIAMQLSNICRDVAEDLGAGRVYLPCNRVDAIAIGRAIHGGKAPDALLVCEATQGLLARADTLYEFAYDGLWSLPRRTRWSILAAAMCYREIGVRVRRDIPLSWRRRTTVGFARKCWLVIVAGLQLLRPRFWRRPKNLAWSPALGPALHNACRALGVNV